MDKAHRKKRVSKPKLIERRGGDIGLRKARRRGRALDLMKRGYLSDAIVHLLL